MAHKEEEFLPRQLLRYMVTFLFLFSTNVTIQFVQNFSESLNSQSRNA